MQFLCITNSWVVIKKVFHVIYGVWKQQRPPTDVLRFVNQVDMHMPLYKMTAVAHVELAMVDMAKQTLLHVTVPKTPIQSTRLEAFGRWRSYSMETSSRVRHSPEDM
ncbi:hypothetical protein AC249_AIPGENE15632 [Exaiptasia diaphana]|nr:hypothetical protein AC249_AIPGENE15632 [Exaiptasia diaphana]